MTKKQTKVPPVEEGLLMAMKALDNQIARALERTPAEREVAGVQKWEAHSERVERVCVLIMDALGEESISLDSLLVLAQAFPKVLSLVSHDLGEEGLGKIRTQYTLHAFESIEKDVQRGQSVLRGGTDLM